MLRLPFPLLIGLLALSLFILLVQIYVKLEDNSTPDYLLSICKHMRTICYYGPIRSDISDFVADFQNFGTFFEIGKLS